MLHWPTANIPIKFSLAMTKHNTCRAKKGFFMASLISLQRKNEPRIKIKLEWKPYFYLIGWASLCLLIISTVVWFYQKERKTNSFPWASRRDSIHAEFCELSCCCCFGQAVTWCTSTDVTGGSCSLLWATGLRQCFWRQEQCLSSRLLIMSVDQFWAR